MSLKNCKVTIDSPSLYHKSVILSFADNSTRITWHILKTNLLDYRIASAIYKAHKNNTRKPLSMIYSSITEHGQVFSEETLEGFTQELLRRKDINSFNVVIIIDWIKQIIQQWIDMSIESFDKKFDDKGQFSNNESYIRNEEGVWKTALDDNLRHFKSIELFSEVS